MSNFPVTFQPQQVPAALAPVMAAQTTSEFSANVGANFAVVSIKGKVFRIKHGGNDLPLMVNYNGQQIPAPSLDVIIPKGNEALSKTFYKDGYTEGSDTPPDCYAEDGVNPLGPLNTRPLVNGAPCTDCRTCPMNVFGSKINQVTGGKGKACADTRKLAVLPSQDLVNDRFGGPMLIRVPAASLANLAEYDHKLRAMGIPVFAVVTRISFDATQAYPKMTFEPVRMIDDVEAAAVLAWRNDLRTDTVLASGQAAVQPPALPAPSLAQLAGASVPTALQQPTVQPVYVPAQAAPVAQPAYVAPAPIQPPAPAPEAYNPFAAAPPQTPVQAAPQVFNPATFVPPAAVAPQQAAQFNTAPPVAQPVPSGAAVDPSFFQGIDALLAS
jgi:hypothetical protein